MAATWGAGLFQDDLATDFAAQIVEGEGLAVLRRTLWAARQARGHLLYELAIQALISAEVLAALGGRAATAMPPELNAWLAGRSASDIPGDLWPLALGAVERVKEDSEVSELWARSDRFRDWIDKVDELLDRLDQSASAS